MLLPYCTGDGYIMTERFPRECPGASSEDGVALQLAAVHTGSPRFISSHLPLSHLNPSLLDTCKVNLPLIFKYVVSMFHMPASFYNKLFWSHVTCIHLIYLSLFPLPKLQFDRYHIYTFSLGGVCDTEPQGCLFLLLQLLL